MREAAGLEFKKKFICGFLQNYQLKDVKAAKVLKFLMKHDEILKRVYLVNNIHSFSNVILISAKESPAPSFLCHLKGESWDNVDEIIAIMVLSPPEELYLCLAGEGQPRLAWELPAKTGRTRGYARKVIKKLEKEILTNFFIREKQRMELESRIDQALDRGNMEEFLNLSSQYRKVLEFEYS